MLKFKRFPNEHVVSTLIRKRIQLAFPSNSSLLNYISLSCSYPKPFDLCSQVFETAQRIADGNDRDVLFDGSTWAIWRLSEPDEILLEAIEEKRNANLRQGELAFKRDWQFCLDCVQEDKLNVGVSYWHTDHQLPGITHCMKHGCPLHTAPEMKSFEKLVLPQYVDLAKSQQHPFSSELYDWSCFVAKIFDSLKRDETIGGQLVDRLKRILAFESNKEAQVTQSCMKYMDQLETEVSEDVLGYLFKYYTRENAKRRLNLIRSALLTENTVTVRNPVYFLILIYWLRNKTELLEVIDDVKIAA